MNIKTKLSRYTIFVIAVWAVCLILLGVGYAMFYAPQTVKLSQLQTQCRDCQAELDQARIEARPESRERLKEKSEEEDRLVAGFSTDTDAETELVFQVGQIANELKIGDFSSKHQKQQSHSTLGQSKIVKESWLDVECMATFEQFAQFVNRLERNNPVIFVEELFFRRTSEKEPGHDVKLQLSFLSKTESKDNPVAIAAE